MAVVVRRSRPEKPGPASWSSLKEKEDKCGASISEGRMRKAAGNTARAARSQTGPRRIKVSNAPRRGSTFVGHMLRVGRDVLLRQIKSAEGAQDQSPDWSWIRCGAAITTRPQQPRARRHLRRRPANIIAWVRNWFQNAHLVLRNLGVRGWPKAMPHNVQAATLSGEGPNQ